MQVFNIVLVAEYPEFFSGLAENLRAENHRVMIVQDIFAMMHVVEVSRPDVVLIATDSPSRDVLEQMSVMLEHAPRPIVMVGKNEEATVVQQAFRAGISAYIVESLAPQQWAPFLQIACAHFEADQELRLALKVSKQQLTDRKIIEKAKGLVMQVYHLSEEDAYRNMRSLAMQHNRKLVDIALELNNELLLNNPPL